ncbi:hypothetical protein E6C27_scaffold673G00170 [Cucumis melo var. makuwa]|uniref:Uncharacterized protein n=1 Tax=Cucumis melo var. makuwa TaxID=1194695 RepID=A0A5A7UAI8_CUCMM|nr:hypothetical protein E6C27_scaffold673G00170 [Cucumis melo var. makuwa]
MFRRMHTSISLVILKDARISRVIPKDAHIGRVIPKDAHIGRVIPKDAHIGRVIPKDAHISLVIPKDAHINLLNLKKISKLCIMPMFNLQHSSLVYTTAHYSPEPIPINSTARPYAQTTHNRSNITTPLIVQPISLCELPSSVEWRETTAMRASACGSVGGGVEEQWTTKGKKRLGTAAAVRERTEEKEENSKGRGGAMREMEGEFRCLQRRTATDKEKVVDGGGGEGFLVKTS